MFFFSTYHEQEGLTSKDEERDGTPRPIIPTRGMRLLDGFHVCELQPRRFFDPCNIGIIHASRNPCKCSHLQDLVLRNCGGSGELVPNVHDGQSRRQAQREGGKGPQASSWLRVPTASNGKGTKGNDQSQNDLLRS